jgi:hypothetical protein
VWRAGVGHRDVEVLSGAPAVMSMKGPWRLHQRGPDTGAAKGSRHSSGDDDDGVPTVASCAPVASLMAVRWWQCMREMKFCEVIQAERQVPNL